MVREKIYVLDLAGNTTAVIEIEFAIGSTAHLPLALFREFVICIRNASDSTFFVDGINMLDPLTFAFLIIDGAAMTMKSIGLAVMEMVMEGQRQFDENYSSRLL